LTPQTIAIFTGRDREIIDISDLDIVILIDPGQSKSGGFIVTGMDWRQRVFVLASLRLELKPPELTDLVFRSVMKWQPRTVAIESDFFMSIFEHWWMSEMQRRGVRFQITPVYTKKKQKDERIDGLSNYYAASQIYHNEAQNELHDEFRRWGKTKNIHIFDALAYGPEVWRPGWAPGTKSLYSGVATGDAVDDRDIHTGYSQID
jgi:hypothetical protein